jgi:hypothetical protein
MTRILCDSRRFQKDDSHQLLSDIPGAVQIAASDLPASPGHPFYVRLNAILDAHGFDRFAEDQCRAFYAPVTGRPGLPPGQYFRLLLVGYFEGIDAERRIAWRAADSLAVRQFVRLALHEAGGSRSHDPVADAAPDRRGDASCCIHLGAAAAGRGRPPQGQDRCHRAPLIATCCSSASNDKASDTVERTRFLAPTI